jgi:hypothetical protein
MDLHSCDLAALHTTRLEADIRTHKEVELYCESFGLGPNWDILPSGTQGQSGRFLLCLNFVLDKYPI